MKQSMVLKKLEKWIASATLRSRQAYFVPRNDADNCGMLSLEIELSY